MSKIMKSPKPRNLGWTLKRLEGAHLTMTLLSDGRTQYKIEHSKVRGVTAEMISWWYGVYADLTLVIDGQVFPAFLISHPTDHISLKKETSTPNETLQPGDHIIIQECYNQEMDQILNERLTVLSLENDFYTLQVSRAGMRVADIEFRFNDCDSGVNFTSKLTVGVELGPLKSLINRIIIPWLYFRNRNWEKSNAAWMQHTVEEIGNFENFLPEIFNRRHQGLNIVWNRD
jgi:hypothetical protein